MKNRIMLGMLLLVLVLLAACAVPRLQSQEDADSARRIETSDSSVDRWVDREAGVVCWIYLFYGISCLPIEQTDLTR